MLSHAEGIYVHTKDGKKLIDGPAGMWCVQVGHGRRELADAMAEQAMALAYQVPWGAGNEPAVLLGEKLASIAPGDLNTVVYATGGSTAVDTALRFVAFYNNVLGRREKKHIISREAAYHGSTYLSASCTGKDREHNNFDFETKTIHRISCAEHLPPAGRHERGRLLQAARGRVRGEDPGDRPRQGGGLHRRADPGLGRRGRPARGLLQGLLGGLQEARHPVHRRRGGDRFRPARSLVRLGGRCSASRPTSSPAPRA